MAFGDNAQSFTTLDDALARQYDLSRERPQFSRLGKTSRWFNVRRTIPFKGKGYFFDALVQPSSPLRMATFSNARSTEFPVARDLKFQTLSVITTDLKAIRGTVKINEIDEKQAKDQRFAVADLVIKVVGELESDFGSQMNAKLHQGSNGSICKVAGIYDADGSSFTGGSAHATAYLNLDEGTVAAINVGDVLDIYDVSSSGGSDTQVKRVVVQGIIYGKDGPWNSGTKVSGIGAGILAEPCAADGSTTSGTGFNYTWEATFGSGGSSGTPADGDFVARSGEFSTSTSAFTNFHGLPDWRDSEVDVYREENGSLLDRELAASAWQMPEVFVVASPGSEVVFDLDEHFRDAEDILPTRMETGRVKRGKTLSGDEQGASITESMLAVMSPALVNQTVRDAVGTQRFTSVTKMSLTDAQRTSLFGQVGFSGSVYHSPTLGDVAMQADPAAQPFEVMILDPNSFFWVEFDGSSNRVQWLDENGTRWHRIVGSSNGTPTFFKQAAAYSFMSLQCDQIAANFFITGVKSDNA